MPPWLSIIVEPLHTPVEIVPRVVIEDCPTYEAEMSITGVVPPVDVIRFVVPLTEVTPVPAGVAHEPSPLQNVVDEAEVPELRFVTGKFPVTPLA